ncbi:MAG: protein-L-isoaspartate(D-aspartate) O-methyltransferase [Candidatus Latescibacterota bacterium]|nr:MAG: protein-L-isoaspartate(D-aspartate) O-methyltransferase [Candidatus Latescibacterota bacterium]
MWLASLFGSDGASRWGGDDPAETAKRFERLRHAMVERQIAARGIRDPRVLAAMRSVPRHEFVPASVRGAAYDDRPLPIGYEQTISQPYIVALMSESLDLRGEESVLEVGTGSGYQAAVLCELAQRVYTIEIIPELGKRARTDLERLGYDNVSVRIGDGYRGWPDAAPFDAIMVTASPEHVPEPLLEQLKPGGRLVLPVGAHRQVLLRITRGERGFESDTLAAVRFVPMTGEARQGGER